MRLGSLHSVWPCRALFFCWQISPTINYYLATHVSTYIVNYYNQSQNSFHHIPIMRKYSSTTFITLPLHVSIIHILNVWNSYPINNSISGQELRILLTFIIFKHSFTLLKYTVSSRHQSVLTYIILFNTLLSVLLISTLLIIQYYNYEVCLILIFNSDLKTFL